MQCSSGPTRAAVGLPIACCRILDVLDHGLCIDADASRVVSAIFQPPQPSEKAFQNFAAAARHAVVIIAKNATHCGYIGKQGECWL